MTELVLEEGEKDYERSQEYKYCMNRLSLGESLDGVRGNFVFLTSPFAMYLPRQNGQNTCGPSVSNTRYFSLIVSGLRSGSESPSLQSLSPNQTNTPVVLEVLSFKRCLKRQSHHRLLNCLFWQTSFTYTSASTL
ncbi:hypothetical protein L1887_09273 [Cichorium endivia]|nr:hypothetical protein L1887_09273 [Cichorium endivia]